jgi:hypothetical protein
MVTVLVAPAVEHARRRTATQSDIVIDFLIDPLFAFMIFPPTVAGLTAQKGYSATEQEG